ncbi:45 kDa subunit of RNA polymerase II [Ceratobasidium sp. 395]|nr:45 kDa subunit of RNA polymerase II [Ceratobasidium sp. 395]
MSENAREEEPPRDDEPFDYLAKPEKFYFDVETDGKVAPREVVMRGLSELQTKLGNIIHGLTPRDEFAADAAPAMVPPQMNGSRPQTNGWAASPAATNAGWGSNSPANGARGNAGWGASPNGGTSGGWGSGSSSGGGGGGGGGWGSPSGSGGGWGSSPNRNAGGGGGWNM